MTQIDRSSVSRYAAAYMAGLSEREARSLSGSDRLETANRHIARWLSGTWIGRRRPPGKESTTVVATMLPGSARSNRKPWVVSQLPA